MGSSRRRREGRARHIGAPVALLVLVLLALAGTAGPAVAGAGSRMSAAAGSYVALGDSYASGEGVEPFLPGTNSPDDRCHRSSLAYSQLLGDAEGVPAVREFWACSGARIGNFYPGQGQGHEAGQLEHLDTGTQLVTLSVGGNDLQFATVLGTCFTMRSCQTKLAPFARLLLDHTAGRLRDLYREVLAQAPQARVLVVGYPRFVAATPSPLCALLGLDVGEARWLVGQVEQFDAVVRRIVDGLDDPRLRYVSTVDAFTGGVACSASSRFVTGLVPRHPVYSFHPTREGQAVLAGRVLTALAGW